MILNLIISNFLLLFVATNSFCLNTWSSTDTSFQIVFLSTLMIDRAQTIEFTTNPRFENQSEDGFAKRFIGSYPSRSQINNYTAVCAIGHTAIAYLLPSPYRTIWQSFWIGVEVAAISNNVQAGIGVRF